MGRDLRNSLEDAADEGQYFPPPSIHFVCSCSVLNMIAVFLWLSFMSRAKYLSPHAKVGQPCDEGSGVITLQQESSAGSSTIAYLPP